MMPFKTVAKRNDFHRKEQSFALATVFIFQSTQGSINSSKRFFSETLSLLVVLCAIAFTKRQQ